MFFSEQDQGQEFEKSMLSTRSSIYLKLNLTVRGLTKVTHEFTALLAIHISYIDVHLDNPLGSSFHRVFLPRQKQASARKCRPLPFEPKSLPSVW
jgi:hypothetical protein